MGLVRVYSKWSSGSHTYFTSWLPLHYWSRLVVLHVCEPGLFALQSRTAKKTYDVPKRPRRIERTSEKRTYQVTNSGELKLINLNSQSCSLVQQSECFFFALRVQKLGYRNTENFPFLAPTFLVKRLGNCLYLRLCQINTMFWFSCQFFVTKKWTKTQIYSKLLSAQSINIKRAYLK